MTRAASDRRGMLAKVHIAKKDLGLDEAAYRDVVLRITGRDSARDATDAQLDALLDEFRRLGWTPPVRPGQRAPSKKSWVRKVWAIWGDLRPRLDKANDDTLRAFVRRQTHSVKNPDGISDPEWLDPAEAKKVIHGL